MSPTECHGIIAFDFSHLFGCSQLIKELKHKLENCLNLLLNDVSGVVDPLGRSDHSSISLSVKMGFKSLS